MSEPPRPPVWADDPQAAWPAVEVASRVAAGEVPAEAVLESAIGRAGAVDPRIGALVTPAYDQARAALRRREARDVPRPPLHGVPTAVKDLDEQRGVRTTFGTLASGHHVSRRTGRTVRQLLATGLVSIGKSAAPEHGMTPTAETPGFTPTRNPWDLDHSCGGSSSGAAALVAAGVLPIAHAADGGGSIRIPASCCGLVGLKPTQGRLVESEDMRGLPVRLVSAGVVTRTVADTAAFLAAAERHRRRPDLPPVDPDVRPVSAPQRIAVLTRSPVGTVHPSVVATVRRTADELADMGHQVEEVAQVVPATLGEDFLLYWAALAQALPLAGLSHVGLRYRPDRHDPWTRGLGRHFRDNAGRLPGALRRLRGTAEAFATFMTRFHLVLTPTLGTPPPRLGWLDVRLPFAEHRRRVEAFTPFTPAFNVTGTPAVSLPVALADGLPVGVQLAAAHGEDQRLLEVGAALESLGFNRPLERTAG